MPRRSYNYGMPRWRDMFSPRQLLAHGYCVQAFHNLVDEDRKLEEARRTVKQPGATSPWRWTSLSTATAVLSRWNPNKGKESVEATFDSHDFGMKWSYAEMAIAIEGLGLEWALNDLDDCIRQLIQMAGHQQERSIPTAS